MTLTEFLNSPGSSKPHYLLVGHSITHSVSPLMHNTALEHHGMEARYHAVSVSGNEIQRLIAHFNNPAFLGSNVTIPYKETLYEAVDHLSPEAAQIGALNTIVKKEGRIVGENTDSYGFIVPIEDRLDEIEGTRAIIFGTGGATKAITYALESEGIEEIVMVSRRPEKYNFKNTNLVMCNYDAWPEYAEESSIIINATPLGMVPNTEASPVKDDEIQLLEDKICYDIVYNPRETKFLKQAKEMGGKTVGGLEMLIWQGAKSFKIWTGKEFPVGLIRMRLDDVFPA